MTVTLPLIPPHVVATAARSLSPTYHIQLRLYADGQVTHRVIRRRRFIKLWVVTPWDKRERLTQFSFLHRLQQFESDCRSMGFTVHVPRLAHSPQT